MMVRRVLKWPWKVSEVSSEKASTPLKMELKDAGETRKPEDGAESGDDGGQCCDDQDCGVTVMPGNNVTTLNPPTSKIKKRLFTS